MIRTIEAGNPELLKLIKRDFSAPEEIVIQVDEIVSAVRERGDEALCAFTARFDRTTLTPSELRVTGEEIKAAYRMVGAEFLSAIRLAKARIYEFHRKQLPPSWLDAEDGGYLGQVIRPLERVGVYVPGGTATYPSSVLMNGIPASVAGVKEIVMVTPPSTGGGISPYTLVAAAEAGISEIYRVGGAQAIAALAYGTDTIRKVDKITGPGNIFVTLAKQQVFGQVDIDMLAGPSEVLIIADGEANPAFVAADILSQAEHDVRAQAVLLTPSWELAGRVREEVERQLGALGRREQLDEALKNGAMIVVTRDLDEAVNLANRYAPEHLELMVRDPFEWLGRIKNAGTVFLGPYAPVSLGDYVAGPNHVLPTGGTARFFSALGVDAFVKRINVVSCNRRGIAKIGPAAIHLAEVEGLSAHARAVQLRLEEEADDEK
ncbi:MAG: histidinol dehydrogenase [Clostridia bacterium]|nr:histidinol dehydrogenase [Clostridia bacterium]MDZ7611068.1 histidinol dehydrogenase [Eubacteriales bacterium]